MNTQLWQKSLMTLVSLFLCAAASAKDATPARAPSREVSNVMKVTCKKCPELNALTEQFMALDYLKEQDKDKGYELILRVLDYADSARDSFHSKIPNMQEFEAFVRLAGAAVPYDMESSLAGLIADLTSKSKSFKQSYERVLATVERCRREEMKSAVEEIKCTEPLRQKGVYEQPGHEAEGEACIKKPAQSLEECFKSAKH
jgi:hypothetical protein